MFIFTFGFLKRNNPLNLFQLNMPKMIQKTTTKKKPVHSGFNSSLWSLFFKVLLAWSIIGRYIGTMAKPQTAAATSWFLLFVHLSSGWYNPIQFSGLSSWPGHLSVFQRFLYVCSPKQKHDGKLVSKITSHSRNIKMCIFPLVYNLCTYFIALNIQLYWLAA